MRGRLREIKYEGSQHQTFIKNCKNKDTIKRFLDQGRIAMKEQPKSQFWKDAVSFMENK